MQLFEKLALESDKLKAKKKKDDKDWLSPAVKTKVTCTTLIDAPMVCCLALYVLIVCYLTVGRKSGRGDTKDSHQI